MFTEAGLTAYIIWSQSSWGTTPWKQPEAGGNATHTAPRLMPSRKLDEQQVLCCTLSPDGSQEHVKVRAVCRSRHQVGMGAHRYKDCSAHGGAGCVTVGCQAGAHACTCIQQGRECQEGLRPGHKSWKVGAAHQACSAERLLEPDEHHDHTPAAKRQICVFTLQNGGK